MDRQVLVADGDGTPTRQATVRGEKNKRDAPGIVPSLICDTCAARAFPETSVGPGGTLRFRYGDDGPVTAIDLALAIPGIEVCTMTVRRAGIMML